MKEIAKVVLLAVMIGWAYGQSPKIWQEGGRFRAEIVRSFDIPAGGAVEMQISGGDIRIRGEQRENIEVLERIQISTRSESGAKEILQAEQTRYAQRGKSLFIQTPPERSRRYSSDFELCVPHQMDLKVNTSGGDVSVAQIGGTLYLSTSGGDIELLGIKGQVEAKTSGGDLTLHKIAGVARISTSGGDIEVSEMYGELQGSTSGGDVEVRSSQVDGQISTSGGDINLVELKGKTFRATTSGGDIGVDKTDCDLFVRTSGGDLVIGTVNNNLEAYTSGGDIDIKIVEKNIKASTSGGDIRVGVVKGFGDLRTSGGDIEVGQALDLKVETSGGDIRIDGLIGKLEASTSGGDIEAHKELVKGVKINAMNLKTSGGDIEVYLPANLPATIDAEIVMSRHSSDAVIDSDFPLQILREEKGSRVYLYGRGMINGGGDLIRLRTSEGSIRILKARVSK